MSLPVQARAVDGIWLRHVPHGAPLFGRASTPADGRRQRGGVVYNALTATAEWYRSLAERGFSPQDYLPYDHHRWHVAIQVADLSDVDRLAAVGLDVPRPSRRTWPDFQDVGEQLWHEDWAGLIAPSAARPGSLVLSAFISSWPPTGCRPLDAQTIAVVPPPPRGMTT